MADVFISYAHEDRDHAELLANALVQCGLTVWWDRQMGAGESIEKVVRRELEAAASVIVLWSVHSVESDWVPDEAKASRDRLIPVNLDQTLPPFSFRGIKTVSLEDWDGAVAYEGFQKIVTAAAKLRGEPPAISDGGHLVVAIHPPKANIKVIVRRAGDDTYAPIWEGKTDLDGVCRAHHLPAIEVTATSQLLQSTNSQPLRMEITSNPINIKTDRTARIILPLPNAKTSPRDIMKSKSRQLSWQIQKHWPTLTVAMLLLAIITVVGISLIPHFKGTPDGMFYVPPIDYHTGFQADQERDSPAGKILRQIAVHFHRDRINEDVLTQMCFDNPPHSRKLTKSFELETHEVTVERYMRYLEQLPEDKKKEATPGEWDRQVSKQRSQKSNNKPSLPVHSVSWSQALAFCQFYGGDLPTSDQWEIAARNLTPSNLPPHQAEIEQYPGTLYPWGNDWKHGVNTQESFRGELMPPCSTPDKTPEIGGAVHQVCDLGGNLSEHTRSPKFLIVSNSNKIETHLLRGGHYQDNGMLGAYGYIIKGSLGKDAKIPYIGFRCIDTKITDEEQGEKGNSYLRKYRKGTYVNLGRPKDLRFEIAALYGAEAGYLLQPEETFEAVGNFFVQTKKISNAEYNTFLRRTKGGHGPWSRELSIPDDYDHAVRSGGGKEDPVRGVSYFDAHAYCAAAGMRLPEAEEWERIVRGNTTMAFPWGNKVENGEGFFQRTDSSSRLIQDMWSVGPEWTSSEGWYPSVETRVLKGLVAKDTIQPSGRGNLAHYFVSMRLPWHIDKKYPDATFRCIRDYEPSWWEHKLGWPARAKHSRRLDFPPGDLKE